jgi:uncharacterized protein YutD
MARIAVKDWKGGNEQMAVKPRWDILESFVYTVGEWGGRTVGLKLAIVMVVWVYRPSVPGVL